MTEGEHTLADPTAESKNLSLPQEKAEKASSQTTSDENDYVVGHDPEKVATHLDDDDTADSLSRIATADYPKAFKLAFIVMALVLSIFLVALDMTIVATAIPKITDEFHSLDQVGWYGSAFFLTLGAFQSTWGKAYKYFPLKASFLVSIAIFELGSLICAVAPNSTTLIVGRAIAGKLTPTASRYRHVHIFSRPWWRRDWIRGLYYYRIFRTARTACSIYWNPRGHLWMCERHWTPPGRSFHDSGLLALVVRFSLSHSISS